MPIVDSQGRVFGRLNLLDATVVLFVFALIPLGYASWILFRAPAARLISVEPTTVIAEPAVRIVLRGEHLRPYMRASLGSRQGWDFLFRDSSRAEVLFRDVEPGVYDVILYDYEKERSRLPNAVTITKAPVPAAQMAVIGWLGNLKADQASQVKPGMTLEGFGAITAVGRPAPQSTQVFSGAGSVEVRDPSAVRVPVSVAMGCTVRSREGTPVCTMGEIDLKPGILLNTTTPLGLLPFQVDLVRSSAPVESVRVTVRFGGEAQILSQIRSGDLDLAKATNEIAPGATVADVAAPRGNTREATLLVQAQRDQAGWVYENRPLRAGAALTLRTRSYEVSGLILTIDPQTTK
jgi:hypothetical protein